MRIHWFAIALLLVAGCSPSEDGQDDEGTLLDTQDLSDAGQDDQRSGDPTLEPDGADQETGDLVDANGPIVLPRDEAPHSSMIEWWYYTGFLTTPTQDRYGFELVTFQGMTGRVIVYQGHFAITDLVTQTFHLDTRMSYEDQREAAEVGFLLDVGGWTMSGHDGHDHLSAEMEGYGIDLDLEAEKPVVMQYGDGVMSIGSEEPFYYYSYTRMGIEGTLTVGEQSFVVTGEAWMDHQWGDMGQDYEGWDWYSLRLDDRTEVMVFTVRGNLGEDFVGGTFVREDGSYQELDAEDIEVEALGEWVSPDTGGVYPAGWTLTIPSIELVATIDPLIEDQEFHDSLMGTPIYWEGICDVSAQRGDETVGGYAYVELTHYAR